MDHEKVNRRPRGRGKGKKKLQTEREGDRKRLLRTENKLRADGGWEGGGVGDGY